MRLRSRNAFSWTRREDLATRRSLTIRPNMLAVIMSTCQRTGAPRARRGYSTPATYRIHRRRRRGGWFPRKPTFLLVPMLRCVCSAAPRNIEVLQQPSNFVPPALLFARGPLWQAVLEVRHKGVALPLADARHVSEDDTAAVTAADDEAQTQGHVLLMASARSVRQRACPPLSLDTLDAPPGISTSCSKPPLFATALHRFCVPSRQPPLRERTVATKLSNPVVQLS